MSERERFEKWVISESDLGLDMTDFCHYDDPETDLAWWSWQAAIQSHESLRKELEELIEKWSGSQLDSVHFCIYDLQSILDKEAE